MQSLHNKSLFNNLPLIISMLISLDGSSPSLPGGGKQLTRVMGAPWPRCVCSSGPLFWDELGTLCFSLGPDTWIALGFVCVFLIVIRVSLQEPVQLMLSALKRLSHAELWQVLGLEDAVVRGVTRIRLVHKGSRWARMNCNAWKCDTLKGEGKTSAYNP